MRREDEKPEEETEKKEAYQPPAIVWEEAWEAPVLALSCAKQLGNPACSQGPFRS